MPKKRKLVRGKAAPRSRRPVKRRAVKARQKKPSEKSASGKASTMVAGGLPRAKRATARKQRAPKRFDRRAARGYFDGFIEPYYDIEFAEWLEEPFRSSFEKSEPRKAPRIDAIWNRATKRKRFVKFLVTRKDARIPEVPYQAQGIEITYGTPIKSKPSELESSDLAAKLAAESRELLEDTGGSGLYQRVRVRIDGDERWISKKRLFDRDPEGYSRSFVMGLETAVRAYGRSLAVQAGDIDPDDPEEYFDDDLTNVDFEILETVVETVTDNAEALKD